MFNQVILVGKLKYIDNINDNCVIDIEIKNIDNTNEIVSDIYISENIYNNVKQYCKIGDLLGLRGHITQNKIMVDKITFLSSQKTESENE